MKPFLLCVIAILIITSCASETTPSTEGMEPIKLNSPDLTRGKLLMQALKERKSTRSFSSKELNLDILSNILWAAHGINRPDGRRTSPTAVNWQEIEIYLAMEKGLYVYKPQEHLLAPVMAKDIREFTGVQDFTKDAPLNLIYVADFSKMETKRDDQLFYSATDTAFISQNVYLFCASEGLATVILGWVEKNKLARIMNLKKHQKVILTQPVGFPR
ncbi:MAG: SagB/ThcOx family dehydrogenase [Candidatus Omnitrophica bacterium]|nr:SagB/ThcOx family dehydrogenase [Candidatus Omnitrophota bacterium]